MRTKRRTTNFIALLAACLVAGCHRSATPEASGVGGSTTSAPVTVETATATIQPIDVVVTAQGTLTPAQGASAKVAPVAAGRIVEIRVREGDRVAAGQVVAVLDNRVSKAQ